jgi:hypothetical protein
MAWKYQQTLTDLKIDGTCPPSGLQGINKEAFRWVFSPIEHQLNFLPNYEFDKVQNNTSNYFNGVYDSERICARCSQSLFVTLDAAILAFNKLASKRKSKLGYTHVAIGTIVEEDGFTTAHSVEGHFSFYENDGCDLKQKFAICAELELD